MRSQGLSKSQRDRNRRRTQGAEASQSQEEDEVEDERPIASSRSKTKDASATKDSASCSNSSQDKSQEASAATALPEDDRVWVQCNTCDKWRALPNTVDPTQLPDIWFCELNNYDDERNCCEVKNIVMLLFLRVSVLSSSTLLCLLLFYLFVVHIIMSDI